MTDTLLTAFATLFVVIDPIGLLPLFVALTQGQSGQERRAIALRACVTAAGILALFGVAGEAFLALIGIGMPAFRISGGLLLFLIAIEMLFQKRTPRKAEATEEIQSDPSVFPLAIPLIAGPGAMASMILLMGAPGTDLALSAALIATMGAVILCAFLLFSLADQVETLLGDTGITLVTRLLGMLLAALSVQFVLDGVADLGLITMGAAG